MSNLTLIKSENFGKVKCDFWQDENGTVLMTREQIGIALEYVEPRIAIFKIHERHKNRLDKFSVVTNLTTTDGKAYETYLYTSKGVMEICRWSQQPKADSFMDWVWDVVESIRKTGFYSAQPKTSLEVLQHTVKVLGEHETRINALDEKVDNQITVTYNQAKEIQFAVKSKVIDLLGGKESASYRKHKGSYFKQLYNDLYNRLGVPSYRDTRKIDFGSAMAYIKAWLPKAEDRHV